MLKQPAVCIVASERNGTLYIGVSSNLAQRVYQHHAGLVKGFTKQYALKTLVYFEMCEDMQSAISREKLLKGKSRVKKIGLIEAENPDWEDLAIKLELFKPQPK